MYRSALLLTFALALSGCGSGVRQAGTATASLPVVALPTAPVPPMTPVPPTVGDPTPPAAPVAVNTCVTFIGDSLTFYWPMSYLVAYDGGCYVNHGIGGTTLPQILDGIDDHTLSYDATVDPLTSRVVVVGGDAYNSINQLNSTAEQMEAQYTLILAKLRGAGVQIVLCTVLPSDVAGFNPRVVALDAWLRSTAADQNIPLVDLYNEPGLVTSDGMLSYAHTLDGIHILSTDYAPFTPVVEAAIHQAAARL